MSKSKSKISLISFAILFCLVTLLGGLCLSFNKPVEVDNGFSHAAPPQQPKDNQAWTEERFTSPIYSDRIISKPEQLAYLAAKVNIVKDPEAQRGTFFLETTIDLSAHVWSPIGTQEFPFMGQLISQTGNGKITGMFVERSATSDVPANAGLFGVLAGEAIVGGIKLEYSLVNCLSQSTSCISAGGIAGRINGGKSAGVYECQLENVFVWGQQNAGGIVGDSIGSEMIVDCHTTSGGVDNPSCENAGGIVGIISGSGGIKACTNGNTVKGKVAGGIVGYSDKTSAYISSCSSSGTITATIDGGIAGRFVGSISNCENTSAARGGIVNELSGGRITNCTNTGKTKAGIVYSAMNKSVIKDCVNRAANLKGGIVNTLTNSTIQNCTNYGQGVSGGIAYTSTGTSIIEDCKNYGANCQAGIVWSSSGTIKNCFNYALNADSGIVYTAGGLVDSCVNYGTCTAAGICGRLNGGIVQSCVNRGNVDGAGIVYSAHDAQIRRCANYGEISGTCAAGILSVSEYYVIIKNCINQGNIIGGNYGGGIIAYFAQDGEVTCCSNSGTIRGEDTASIGGIVGCIEAGSVAKFISCLNTGAIVLTDAVTCAGGLCGMMLDSQYIEFIGCFTKHDIINETTGLNMAVIYAGSMLGLQIGSNDGNALKGCGAVVGGDGLIVGNKFYADATSINPEYFGAEALPIKIDSSYALVYDISTEGHVAAVANSIDSTHEDFFSVNDNFMDGYPVPRDIFWIGEHIEYASHGGIIALLQNIANNVEEYDGNV